MIPTAEEILNNTFELHKYRMAFSPYGDSEEAVFEAMIEFAKLHVEQALKEASEKATTDGYGDGYAGIDEESILTAYPLENIK